MVPFDNLGVQLFRILSDLHALAHTAASAARSVSQDHHTALYQAIMDTEILCEQGIDSVMLSLGSRDMQASIKPAELVSSMPMALPHNVSDPTGIKVTMRAAHEALAAKWTAFANIAPAAEAMASRAFATEHAKLVATLGVHNGSPEIA